MVESRQADGVVKATPSDHAQMSHVIIKCLREVNSVDYPADVINDLVDRHRPENIGVFLQDKYALAFKRHGTVIGTGVLAGCEIATVFVLPETHGRGVGRLIIEALKNEASRRGLNDVEIHSSLNAVEFYERLGYVHLESVHREVGGRSVRMRKKLKT